MHSLIAGRMEITIAGQTARHDGALVRSIFYAVPGQALGGAMTVHTQAQEFDAAHPTDGEYVENVWFEKSGVMFVTLNLPGGSNNDTDIWYQAPTVTQSQTDEVANRSAADLRWLDSAFAKVAANGDQGLVIMEQADMWDRDGGTDNIHLTEYKQLIDEIAAQTTSFAKPVLLINGDSHFYRSDNPLAQGAACAVEVPSSPIRTISSGYNVANFHRVVVHGNATPSSGGSSRLFSFAVTDEFADGGHQ